MTNSTLTRKGQTTIPKDVRDYLGVQAGDRLVYVIDDRGEVVLKAANVDISEIRGMFAEKGRHALTIEEMHDQAALAVAASMKDNDRD